MMNYFFKKIEGKTLLMIAHRIRTIVNCDWIMVLEKGKIVEFDDKEKLLNTPSSKFKTMYDKSLKQVDKWF